MKDLLGYIPVIQAYPTWLQVLVIAWVVSTVALGILLFLHYPGPAPEFDVKIDDLRIARDATSGTLTIEVIARNPLPQSAQLVELHLSFFGEAKPKGGLQGYDQVSATYIVASGNEAGRLISGAAGDVMRYETRITYPFTGQEYAEIKIPLSQSIKKDESDRFVVKLETKELPRESHRQVEAIIRYNGTRLSEPRVARLSR